MAIVIPQVSQGLTIPITTGGYQLNAGYTAVLLLRQSGGGEGPTVTLTLAFTNGQSAAQYETTGNEFNAISGYCDAELKVFNGAGVLLYSDIAEQAYYIKPVLG